MAVDRSSSTGGEGGVEPGDRAVVASPVPIDRLVPALGRAGEAVVDATVDLLLGSACTGCERPGRLLCHSCAATLDAPARVAWPSPAPAGLATPWAAADYADVARALVLGHKERAMHGLRGPLADLLARAVAAAVDDAGAGARPVVLVPVPSRPATVRSRGHDPTRTITRRAATALRGRGRDVLAAPVLRLRRRVADQATLDAAGRAANLAGSMWCPSRSLRRLSRSLAGRRTDVAVVVCDDVLTTGSTAREAQRALEASGLRVLAVATAAATRKRTGE